MHSLIQRRPGRRRALQFIELVFIFPIMLFFLLLSVDLARMTLTASVLNDISYSAARWSAQRGGVSVAQMNDYVANEINQNQLSRALYGTSSVSVSGDYQKGVCAPPVSPSSFTTVTISYNYEWMAPLMDRVSDIIASGASDAPDFRLASSSSSRCEVIL